MQNIVFACFSIEKLFLAGEPLELEYDLDDPDVSIEMGYDLGGPSASEEAQFVLSIPGATFHDLPEAGMDFPTDFHHELQVNNCFCKFLYIFGCDSVQKKRQIFFVYCLTDRHHDLQIHNCFCKFLYIFGCDCVQK